MTPNQFAEIVSLAEQALFCLSLLSGIAIVLFVRSLWRGPRK